MPSITSTLRMMDAMSGPLTRVIKQMDTLIASAERINRVMSTVPDQQKMVQANQQIVHVTQVINNNYQQINNTINQNNLSLNQTNNLLNQTVNNQQALNNAINQGGQQADNLWDKLKKVAGVYLGFQGIKKAYNFVSGSVSDALGGSTDEMKLAQVLNTRMGLDAKGIEDFKKQLKSFSLGSGRGSVRFDALVAGAGEMGTYLHDKDALLTAMRTASDMAAAQYGVNTTPEQMYNLATGAGKVFSGQAGGLSRQGWILDDSDVKAFKVGSDMEKAATFAALAADSYGEMNAVIAQTPEAKVRSMSETFNEMSLSLGNNLLPAVMYAVEEIKSRFNGALDSGKMDTFFQNLGIGLANVFNAVMFIVDGVVWLADVIQQNWGIIEPILIAITLVYLPMMISKLWATDVPLTAMVGKWLAMHWPILLIIAAIAAVLFILSKLGVKLEQIVGFIGGLFGTLYANVYNVVAAIWNYWASFIEFFANAFNHPVYSIKKLFVNLANSTLDLVKQIAEAIDWVFGSDLAGNITSLQDKMEDWLGEMPEGYKVVQRMEEKSIVDAAKSGYDMGAGFVQGIGNALDGFKMDGLDGFAPREIDSIGSVGEVGKIKDKVDISSEDLKTMRELAEMKNIQNFVTLTPSVVFGDTHVKNESDIQTIIARISDAMDEHIASSARGVYPV